MSSGLVLVSVLLVKYRCLINKCRRERERERARSENRGRRSAAVAVAVASRGGCEGDFVKNV